jgi:hypothetical protein
MRPGQNCECDPGHRPRRPIITITTGPSARPFDNNTVILFSNRRKYDNHANGITLRFSGSPTQLTKEAAYRRGRCKRLLDFALGQN